MKGENLIRVEMSRKDAEKLLENISHVQEETATQDVENIFWILRLGDTLGWTLKEGER